ncbi:phospholipase D family nuclease [Sulfuriferula thiophila]|uniref:phospholipase D family nuclease n=1 Tax=Sulfuriferula thiophila TaxID=1781211 RepID=UPI000F611773|nr:phospholipase D family protein [Sulfuriferula thiophila]
MLYKLLFLINVLWSCQATALQPATAPQTAVGSIQVAFTPGDDAAGLIMQAIRHARKQILVQAYSFTHIGIADALIRAHQRGIEVLVIADSQQSERIPTSLIRQLAAAGIPVLMDSEHLSAHNKVMIIDADNHPVVITGSYNFTHAAQFTNAENLLVLHDNPGIADAYRNNWQRHREHSLPLLP